MTVLNNIFDIGQKVYLETDPNQCQRIVTGILLRPNGAISYALCGGGNEETWHYDFEINKDKDYTK